ncbi:hypothetical protein [Rheinheimera hassiensis]|uniref:hypothetical protein n=1 Tax=Rheinheimera hassiensis TaxID=1193627 RepID=UPI001F06F568|nr:hypothetical protein [Rheinheimera hassiensis]
MKNFIFCLFIFSFSCFGSDVNEAYTNLGIDQTGRDWSIEDYKLFDVAIKSKQFPLPVANSSDSGMVFKSLTSEGNLILYRNSKMTNKEAAQYAAGVNRIVNNIIQAYYGAHISKVADYESEIAILMSYMAKITADIFQYTNKYIQSIKSDGINQSIRDGFVMITNGFERILNGLLVSIGEDIYSTDSRVIMSKAVDDNVGLLIHYMSDYERCELINEIMLKIKLNNNKYITGNLNNAVEKLRGKRELGCN